MSSSYRSAIILNLSASLVWSFTAVMIRYVGSGFPVMFQSFARYIAAIIVLWPLFFTATAKEERIKIRGNLSHLLPKMALIAVANFSFQAAYTAGLYKVFPGLAILIYQSAAVFSVLLGCIFFIDERLLLKKPLFYASILSAVIGVVLTISPGNSGGSSFSLLGVGLVLFSAFSWAVLSAMVRAWLPGYSPYFVNAAVFTFVIPMFLVSHIATRGMQFHFDASPWLWFVLILSGLAGIGLGHSLFYRSVPVLGVSLANILQLTRPFFTALVSFFIFAERLTVLQITGGILLIGGAYSVTKLKESKQAA